MNAGKLEWNKRLNRNEIRILNVFLEGKCSDLVSRPYLEGQFCKTKLMNQRTLTNRLNYLVEKGCIEKITGRKGAVFYAPRPAIDRVLMDADSKRFIDNAVDNMSPKKSLIISMPVRVKGENVSAEEMCRLLVQAALTWDKEGTGSERQKAAHYRELLRRRKELVRKASGTGDAGV